MTMKVFNIAAVLATPPHSYILDTCTHPPIHIYNSDLNKEYLAHSAADQKVM